MISPGTVAAFIITPMRFFVLLLLMLLLPLSEGAGNAMAATTHPGHALEDCAGHTGQAKGKAESTAHVTADSPAGAKTASALADCDACSACQACHAVALVFSADDVQTMPTPHAAPAAASLQFASAPAARDQKPPIS